MEFRFNIEPMFKEPIIRVNSNLLPESFRGDRRAILDTATKMAEIVNEMGEASARAQGLNKPVTTAQKLRMSDQIIYLLGDPKEGKNGAVIGLLKVGKKNLYVFNENGDTQMVNAPCVLDFYVHESRQRAGLGKDLFETMLKQENYVPAKMAVDRPSDKLLGFLRKHYGLEKTIPQMNNFVVYEGFFGNNNRMNSNHEGVRMHMTSSPNTALFGPQFINDEAARRVKLQHQNVSGVPLIQNSPVGRYAAPRPMGSMAEIIHSSATPATGEPNSEHPTVTDECQTDEGLEDVEGIKVNIENLQININETENVYENPPEDETSSTNGHHHSHHHQHIENDHKVADIEKDEIIETPHIKKPTYFPLSKQHTGLKNISYNVGIAVSPTNKMEFVQEEPESFGVLKINRPIGKGAAGLQTAHDNTDAASIASGGSGDGFTDQGYFDLKFYHNKLW